jgi:hypothetical protein
VADRVDERWDLGHLEGDPDGDRSSQAEDLGGRDVAATRMLARERIGPGRIVTPAVLADDYGLL